MAGLLNALRRGAGSGTRWPLAAVVLWATRRRSACRAALRGLLDAAAAGAVTRLLPRAFDGRSRADAMATAFAAGAALESPAAGAAAAMLAGAAAPAADRRGALAGAALALGSHRLWPVPPADGPLAPKIFVSRDAAPAHGGDGLFVAVNTESGNGNRPPPRLAEELPRAEVEEVEIVDGPELRKALDEGAERSAALGVAGGDGSVNTAAQVALDHGKPLAVFPSGTFNHLAGALSIETPKETAAAIERGEAVSIDAATIDGHVFVNTASFGAYVELVDMRQKLEKRLGKWPAVVVALVRVLRHSKPVAVEIEGRRTKVWMAFIGNCRYSPSGFAPSWRDRLDDGRIDFRYVDGSAPLARSRLVLAVLTGRLASCKVYEQLVVPELRIRSLQGPLRLARDGETFVSSSDEIVVRKLPRRLAVYCPHEEVG